MKKRLFFLTVFVFLIYAAVAKTAFTANLLLTQLSSRLNPQQLLISADQPRASLLGLDAKAFSLKFPRIFSSFDFSEFSLAPSWMALFGGRLGLELRASAYAGNIQAGVITSFKGVAQQIDIKVSQLNLVQHPIAALIGLSSGVLDIDARIDQASSAEKRSGRVRLELHNLARPSTPASAFAELAKLPEMNVGQLIVDGSISGQVVEIANANMNSDLGSASGRGSLTLAEPAGISQIDLRFNFNLTPQGVTTLGPLFQKNGDPAFAHLEPTFSVRISGSPLSRTVRMVRE